MSTTAQGAEEIEKDNARLVKSFDDWYNISISACTALFDSGKDYHREDGKMVQAALVQARKYCLELQVARTARSRKYPFIQSLSPSRGEADA